MENGSSAGAAGWLAALALAVVISAVSAVQEPSGVTGAAHGASASSAISRFAVSFEEPVKHHVKEQLLQQGYVVLSEGPGFYAVTHSKSLEVPVSTRTEAARVAHADTAASVTPDPRFNSGSRARRRLIEKQLRKHTDAQHLIKLSAIPGVHSSEHDVRRHLHVRPSYVFRGLNLLPETAEAVGARLHSRRLSVARDTNSATDRSSGLSQQTVASPAEHLTGHWHTSKSIRPSQYEIWGSSVGDLTCAGKDVQLADAAGAEVLPWGISAIGARNQKLLSAKPKGRAIVCIIDSGIWAGHPEYMKMPGAPSDQIGGCKVTANCPYDWASDIVGHGTHVAGTIGAPQNGVGVIGVISNGAEIHVVRIWNDSGDVSQGQGPYATDLILAYDNCLAYLEEQQKSDKKAKMVINMSYGSAGPLTAERLWIQKAAQRGDVLFVGSAGNNGTYLAGQSYRAVGQQPEPGQYLSYPASYPFNEVLSVANMRCDGTIDFSSQKNDRVSISAPGMAILSSVPRDYGAIRAYITTNKPLPKQMAPADADSFPDPVGELYGINDSGSSSSGTTRSKSELKVQSGLGYLPSGYREPRAIQGSAIGSSGALRISQCSVAAEVKSASVDKSQSGTQQSQAGVAGCTNANLAVCMVELPGSIDWYHETCLAMLKCIRGGGKGLIVWRNDSALMDLGDNAGDFYIGFQPDQFLLGTQINCGTRCACWAEMRKQLSCSGDDCAAKTPPGLVVATQHAQALLNAAKASSDFRVNITNYEYNYRHYDGTSMAAPHVTGAAAVLWRLFPDCSAADISEALKQSAQKLPDQVDVAAGHGLLRVDRAYDWIQQNKQCARS